MKGWTPVSIVKPEPLLIGYAKEGSPLLWRGHAWRKPPLKTYAQWREHLLSLGGPCVEYDQCLWTGEAFLQCVETDFAVGEIAPALFQGMMFRRESDGIYFIDEDLDADR